MGADCCKDTDGFVRSGNGAAAVQRQQGATQSDQQHNQPGAGRSGPRDTLPVKHTGAVHKNGAHDHDSTEHCSAEHCRSCTFRNPSGSVSCGLCGLSLLDADLEDVTPLPATPQTSADLQAVQTDALGSSGAASSKFAANSTHTSVEGFAANSTHTSVEGVMTEADQSDLPDSLTLSREIFRLPSCYSLSECMLAVSESVPMVPGSVDDECVAVIARLASLMDGLDKTERVRVVLAVLECSRCQLSHNVKHKRVEAARSVLRRLPHGEYMEILLQTVATLSANHATQPPTGPFHYVDAAGQAQGPVDINQLRDLFASSTVTASMHVICQGLGETDWMLLSAKPQLLAALSTATAFRDFCKLWIEFSSLWHQPPFSSLIAALEPTLQACCLQDECTSLRIAAFETIQCLAPSLDRFQDPQSLTEALVGASMQDCLVDVQFVALSAMGLLKAAQLASVSRETIDNFINKVCHNDQTHEIALPVVVKIGASKLSSSFDKCAALPVKMLKDSREEVRCAAVKALGEFRYPDRMVYPMVECLSDQSAVVRATAVKACLGVLGKNEIDQIPGLKEHIDKCLTDTDQDGIVRAATLSAMVGMPSTPRPSSQRSSEIAISLDSLLEGGSASSPHVSSPHVSSPRVSSPRVSGSALLFATTKRKVRSKFLNEDDSQ